MLRHCNKLNYNLCAKKTDATWMAYKVFRNICTSTICIAKRHFFLSNANTNSTKFGCQVKTCTGLGKLKQHLIPWPFSTQAISKASANGINEHFTASVQALISRPRTSSTNTKRPPAISDVYATVMAEYPVEHSAQCQNVYTENVMDGSQFNGGFDFSMISKSDVAKYICL